MNPGESTTPLFRKLAAVSYLEGELDASVSYDVPVIASVIQEQDGSKTLKEIYQEYLKQADIDQKEGEGMRERNPEKNYIGRGSGCACSVLLSWLGSKGTGRWGDVS